MQYEFAFSTGYNARPNPCVHGRGAGIFVHVFDRDYTAGCVAVSRPACAIGTLRSGQRSCIFAY